MAPSEIRPQSSTPPPAGLRAETALGPVFLPKEHGSWSLAFEPLALGLLIAPSVPGGALFAVAAAGFFARRPLKAALAPAFSERRRAARTALAVLGALAIIAGLELLALADVAALWPVLLAVPCGLLFAYFDRQGEGRAAAAEVAGSAAFAMLPAVFASLAGWGPLVALALAALALVRSVPTVLTVRTFLRQRKGERVLAWLPVASAVGGLGLIAGFAWRGALPWLVLIAPGVLLARSLWLTGSRRPAWSARQAGMLEAGLGLGYCGFLALLPIG